MQEITMAISSPNYGVLGKTAWETPEHKIELNDCNEF